MLKRGVVASKWKVREECPRGGVARQGARCKVPVYQLPKRFYVAVMRKSYRSEVRVVVIVKGLSKVVMLLFGKKREC